MTRPLVIKLTSGSDNLELCSQAFTVASSAVALGSEVSMWLTGNAVYFAIPGVAEGFDLDLAAPLAELRDAVMAGGALTVCTQCIARRDIDIDHLINGVRIAGATTFVEEALGQHAQALIY